LLNMRGKSKTWSLKTSSLERILFLTSDSVNVFQMRLSVVAINAAGPAIRIPIAGMKDVTCFLSSAMNVGTGSVDVVQSNAVRSLVFPLKLRRKNARARHREEWFTRKGEPAISSSKAKAELRNPSPN